MQYAWPLRSTFFQQFACRCYKRTYTTFGDSATSPKRYQRLQSHGPVERARSALWDFNVGALGCDVSPFRRCKSENGPKHDQRYGNGVNGLNDPLGRQVAETAGDTFQCFIAPLKLRVLNEALTLRHGQKLGPQRAKYLIDI